MSNPTGHELEFDENADKKLFFLQFVRVAELSPFGFPPVVAYYVLPLLDYRSCCSCLSYVNQTYEDSDHESDDDESEDNADQVLQSSTQNQLHLNVPTEESWDSD